MAPLGTYLGDSDRLLQLWQTLDDVGYADVSACRVDVYLWKVLPYRSNDRVSQ